MNKNKNFKAADFVEILGLCFICLFASYLLFSEIRQNKRCVVDLYAQDKGRCL